MQYLVSIHICRIKNPGCFYIKLLIADKQGNVKTRKLAYEFLRDIPTIILKGHFNHQYENQILQLVLNRNKCCQFSWKNVILCPWKTNQFTRKSDSIRFISYKRFEEKCLRIVRLVRKLNQGVKWCYFFGKFCVRTARMIPAVYGT